MDRDRDNDTGTNANAGPGTINGRWVLMMMAAVLVGVVVLLFVTR